MSGEKNRSKNNEVVSCVAIIFHFSVTQRSGEKAIFQGSLKPNGIQVIQTKQVRVDLAKVNAFLICTDEPEQFVVNKKKHVS